MKKNNGAFTLIEVLIALLIIAIALAAAIRATSASIRATIHVRNTVTAHWIGLNILSEIQTGIITLPTSSNQISAKTSFLNREWPWIAHFNSSSQLSGVTKITVTVYLKNKAVNSVVGYL